MENKGLIKQVWGGELLQADLEENLLKVVACTIGAPLLNGYVLFPGAFKAATKGMVSDGSLLIGHDWGDLPIGMILSAKETGSQLICEAKFHSTSTAQDARTICKERMEAGKSVSVSIGYYPDWEGALFFENGSKLLEFAKNNGYDLSLFDSKTLKAYDSYLLGIFKVVDLVEFSIVAVGADPNAKAISVQNRTFDEQFFGALGALDDLVTRWEGIAQKREKLGPTHQEKLEQLVNRLEVIAQLSEPAPEAGEDPTNDDAANRFATLAHRTMSHKTALLAG